jgi:hypothetical protein
LVLVAASLGLSLGAQTVTGSAVALTDCNLRAEHLTFAPLALRTIEGGADMTLGYKLDAVSGAASGSFQFRVDQSPVTTFSANVRVIAPTFGYDMGAELSSDADFRLSLHADTPAYGMLNVEVRAVPSQGAPGVGNFWVDVDNDGKWDVVGDISGRLVQARFVRHFGPGEQVIRVLHTGSVSVPANFIGDYGADLVVSWIPIGGTITSYGSPCGIELGYARLENGDYRLFTSPVVATPTLYLFGDTETKDQLKVPPYCTLRNDVDFVVDVTGAPYLEVPMVPLPPGFLMHVQAMNLPILDASTSTILLSNGLRLDVAR